MAEMSEDVSGFPLRGSLKHCGSRPRRRRLRRGIRFTWAALACALICGQPIAANAQSGARQLAVPPAETLLLLIRTTLVALNHANQTGNYTVLREIAAPVFQNKFTAADLGAVFANLRARRLDLAPVVIVTPELSKPPAISPAGHLLVAGHFPTKPVPIRFQLIFVASDGLWKLAGLTVNAPNEPPNEPSPNRTGNQPTMAPAGRR